MSEVTAPRRDRRHLRHEATRQEIIDAAWELVRLEGAAALSLRALARAVGMEAQSLYTYFPSKHAIYDALFADGNRELLARYAHLRESDDPVEDLRRGTRVIVKFCVEDGARYQLLFQRSIPGFEPSEESYAIARDVLASGRGRLARVGVADPAHFDLYTAVIAGIIAQQNANEPGGRRWTRLLDEAIDMYLDHIRNKKSRKERK